MEAGYSKREMNLSEIKAILDYDVSDAVFSQLLFTILYVFSTHKMSRPYPDRKRVLRKTRFQQSDRN